MDDLVAGVPNKAAIMTNPLNSLVYLEFVSDIVAITQYLSSLLFLALYYVIAISMATQSGDGIQVPRTGGASSHASGRSELAPRDVTVPRARPVPKLRDVVELYIKNRLPGDIHPSFQHINGLSPESSRPSLPASSQTEPTLITKSVLASDGDNFTIEENGSFDAEAIYAEAESEKARFCDSLETYEQVADPKYRTNITLKGKNHTWDEVLEEVRKVVDKKSDGFWSKVRQGLENFGESNDAFDAWMGLLPTQSQYCSLLCGGLKLVVRVSACRRDDN